MLDQCILLHLIASNFVVVFVLQPRDKLGPRPRVNNFDWHISVGLWKLILCSGSQITQWKELFSSILDVFCSKIVAWILRESGVVSVRRITKILAPCLSDSWVLHFVMRRSKLIRIETVLHEIRLLPSRYLAKTSYLFRKTINCQRVFLPDNPRDQEPSNRLLSRHKGKERVYGEKGVGETSFSGLFP